MFNPYIAAGPRGTIATMLSLTTTNPNPKCLRTNKHPSPSTRGGIRGMENKREGE